MVCGTPRSMALELLKALSSGDTFPVRDWRIGESGGCKANGAGPAAFRVFAAFEPVMKQAAIGEVAFRQAFRLVDGKAFDDKLKRLHRASVGDQYDPTGGVVPD